MNPRLGTIFFSTTDATRVIVIRWDAANVEISCGDILMVNSEPAADEVAASGSDLPNGTEMGKRYADEELGIEVLCTRAGHGELSVSGKPLKIKTAKPLPASD